MNFLNIFKIGFAALLLMHGVTSHAAVTHITSGVELIGATGIEIDTDNNPATAPELFSVDFVDGTFNSVFGGTIPIYHASVSDANLFANALIDQVFINISGGPSYDNEPELTRGCENISECYLTIPYRKANSSLIETVLAVNAADPTSDRISFGGVGPSFNLRNSDFNTFAVFTLQPAVSAVPEPATYAMMLAGVMMVAGVKRRRFNA